MQDLSGLYISQSFQNLVQRSASGAFNVLGTATGTEFIPISASYAISASHASNADLATTASYVNVNLQQVLENGNTASLGFKVTGDARVDGKLIVSGSSNSVFDIDGFDLEITGGLDVSRDVAVRDDLTVYDDTNLQKDTNIGYRGDSPGFGYSLAVTQSINNSGSAKFVGDVNIEKNEAGVNPTLTIEDKANNSFTEGPTLQFSGSRISKIETNADQSLTFNIGESVTQNVGKQYKIDKANFQTGDFQIIDDGSRTALYKHENLTETGSIKFANSSTDVGIGLEMDDNRMALSMRSGSAFVPIVERKVNTKEINLYDSTASTGSSAQVLTSNASGGIEWQTAAAAAAFPYTGSAQITGSLAVTGSTNISLNELGTAPTLIIQDDANDSFSIGPTLKFSGSRVGIIESDTNKNLTIEATQDLQFNVENQFGLTKDNSVGDAYQFINNGSLWAKFQNENLRSTGSITFADPTIDVGIGLRMDNDKMALQMYSGSSFVPIIERALNSRQVNLYDSNRSIGSSAQVLSSNAQGGIEWVAAGGSIFPYTGSAEITGSLGVTGSTAIIGDLNVTGSILGAGSIRAGQQAGAFSSDTIVLGNATTPVQYGNMTIFTNTTTYLGNNYNGYTIDDPGKTNIQLASTSFSGEGDNVHVLALGANSVGRTDNIKLWASGSEATLNLSSDVKITDANKLTMSGSIELASSTGSVGQVIGVDASGIAKWEDLTIISSSYALSSSYAVNADVAISSSHAVQADSAISSSHALNADNAISSSHAINADVAISSSHAVNADASNTSISASHALIADNGGVTSIVAGTNVTISPVSGLGDVTINASGGGGGITSFSLEPRTTTFTSASAPGADVIFMTASIPGGTFVPGDILEFRFMVEQSGGTSGTNYTAVGIASGSWAPGTPYPYSSEYYGLASLQNGSNGKCYFQKTLYINSATETAVWSSQTNDSATENIQGGDPIETLNIDWTTTQCFHYGSNIENTTSTLKHYGGCIRKIN